MFIRNFNSINPKNILWVGSKTKEYLLTKGFLEISKNNGLWGFSKTKKLDKIIDIYKENGGDIND